MEEPKDTLALSEFHKFVAELNGDDAWRCLLCADKHNSNAMRCCPVIPGDISPTDLSRFSCIWSATQSEFRTDAVRNYMYLHSGCYLELERQAWSLLPDSAILGMIFSEAKKAHGYTDWHRMTEHLKGAGLQYTMIPLRYALPHEFIQIHRVIREDRALPITQSARYEKHVRPFADVDLHSTVHPFVAIVHFMTNLNALIKREKCPELLFDEAGWRKALDSRQRILVDFAKRIWELWMGAALKSKNTLSKSLNPNAKKMKTGRATNKRKRESDREEDSRPSKKARLDPVVRRSTRNPEPRTRICLVRPKRVQLRCMPT